VLVASALSFLGGLNVASYAASKARVAQLAKALSNELAGRGVRVNAETGLTADIEDWKREEIEVRIPLRRWGAPAEVAAVVAWLLSDGARYVIGTVMPVGGVLAR
jgi:2-deoxy-D-gluconate 3-dehydrogenase